MALALATDPEPVTIGITLFLAVALALVAGGASHTAGLRSDPELWETTVVNFLDDALT